MKLELELSEAQLDALADRLAERGGSKRRTPYTLNEAATALAVSRDTVRRRVKAGLIQRVPGIAHIRIPSAEIERLQGGEAAR